jgi:LemA protein
MPSSSPAQTAGLEGSLTANLRSLLALAEAYPDLKASAGFLDLQRNLTETETQIQHARRYYNGTVNNLNTRIQTFPDLLVARIFNFLPAEYFEPDPSVSE